MAHNSGINIDVTLNSDGFAMGGGTTKRTITITSGDISLTGVAGGYTYTMPSATSTLVGDTATQTLTNKTLTGVTLTANTTTVPSMLISASSAVDISSPSSGQLWYDGTYLYFKDNVAGYTKMLNKRKLVMVLCAGFTPSATGGDVAEFVVPYHTDGTTSITWTVNRITFRVQTAGGTPAVTVEVYTGTGAFSATTVGSVTLGSGASEGSTTGSFTTSTVASGNKLRINPTTITGGSANWTVEVEFVEA